MKRIEIDETEFFLALGAYAYLVGPALLGIVQFFSKQVTVEQLLAIEGIPTVTGLITYWQVIRKKASASDSTDQFSRENT